MFAPASFRERLPSAAAAIAVQAGLLALLVFSFEVVRQAGSEHETILTLPPLVRPAPPKPPVTVRPKPPAAVTAAPPPLPAYALPSFSFSAPQTGDAPLGGASVRNLAPDIAKCDIGNYGNLDASARKHCPPPEDMVRRDPNVLPFKPDRAMKNAPTWQGEVDRRNAPSVIPGGDPLGAVLTLFSNPGAFLDKRNYTTVPPPPPMDGAEMTRQYALHGSGCPELDDTTKRNCQIDRGAVTMHSSPPIVAVTHPHATDAAFAQALAATQARTRSLYGAPVLASGAKRGGGNGEIRGSGGKPGDGGAAGGGVGPGR